MCAPAGAMEAHYGTMGTSPRFLESKYGVIVVEPWRFTLEHWRLILETWSLTLVTERLSLEPGKSRTISSLRGYILHVVSMATGVASMAPG